MISWLILQLILFMGSDCFVNCLYEINHDQPDHSQPNPHVFEQGKCPYKPGDIQSKVGASFDFQKMEGIWKIIYDERALNDNFTCMGAKFMNVADFDGHVLEFMQSYGATEQFRDYYH